MSTQHPNPPTSVLPPSKLAHVVLRTNNYHPMIDFYRTFLGARIAYANDMITFLSYDDEHHRIGILNLPSLANKDPRAAGLEHIAFTFDTLEQLAEAWQQRKDLGITPFWTVNHGVTLSVYYRDPDGNNVETQVDAMSVAEADTYMASEEFRINPVGVDFEMEDLVKRLAAGEDRASIVKRPASGPRSPMETPHGRV